MFSHPKELSTKGNKKYILIGEPIGDGKTTTCIVYKGLDSETGKEYAIKFFNENYNSSNEIKMNIKITQMGNPSFVKYIEHSEEYIIFDLCERGDLIDNISKINNDKLIKFIIFKILKAVQFLHQNGICHRDLKPDNIFWTKNFYLKLGDFGQSVSFFDENNNKKLIEGVAGTPQYKAPEMYKKSPYDGEKIDIFSIGVILFVLKLKVAPFEKATYESKAYKCIMQKGKEIKNFWQKVGVNPIQIQELTKDFKDLFLKMVAYNPSERPAIKDILKEPWMKEISSLDENALNTLEQDLITELKE